MRYRPFVLLAIVLLPGCSAAFVQGPSSAIVPVGADACTESNTLPALDLAAGILGGLAALGWSVDTGISNRGVGAPPSQPSSYRTSWGYEEIAKAGAVLGLFISSGVGFDRVNTCRERLRLSR